MAPCQVKVCALAGVVKPGIIANATKPPHPAIELKLLSSSPAA
jgi:hypothetical protein